MMNMSFIMTLGAMGPDESSLMNESYKRKNHQKISAGLSAMTQATELFRKLRKLEFFKRGIWRMYPQIAISSNLDYMISTITMTNLLLLEHDKPLNQNLKGIKF